MTTTAPPTAAPPTADQLVRDRVPFVRATVVRAQAPTSARPGDTALVLADGVLTGFVGGSCAESSVREYGLRVLADARPLLLRIVPGEVPGAVEDGTVTVVNPCLSGGALEVFLEPRLPAPRVVVVGETPVARALAELGGPLGFAVELTAGSDARPGADDAALVVASHGREEEPALRAALAAGVGYVGLVASRARGTAVLAALDLPADQLARVHTPAGLDLGSRTAPEVALSILAQLVAHRRAGRVPATAPGTAPAPVSAIDPVCGMTVAAVPASLHVEHAGGTVWFCGPGCRTSFLSDPSAHGG